MNGKISTASDVAAEELQKALDRLRAEAEAEQAKAAKQAEQNQAELSREEAERLLRSARRAHLYPGVK